MKKITAILLAVIIMLGCISVMAVNATKTNTTASITVDCKTYNAEVGKKVTYTIYLNSQHKVNVGEFYIGYPQSMLSIENDSSFDFPVVGKNNVTYNYNENLHDEFRFNFSHRDSPADFTNGGVLFTITFTVTAAGTGSIGFINDADGDVQPGPFKRESVLSWIDENDVIHDELPNATFTETLTQPTKPSINPTVPKTKPTVKKAQKITAKFYTKTYGSKAFNLNAKTSGNGKLTYKTSNKKVVTVSAKGKVTIKGCGKATITIKAYATSKYKAATKRITVTVKPATVKISSIIGKNNYISIEFQKQYGLSGYEVEVAKKSSFSPKVSNRYNDGKRTSIKITGVSKGQKYYVRIRAYAKVAKKTVYSKWTKRTINVK